MTKTATNRVYTRKTPETVQRLRVFSCNDTLWAEFCGRVGERERSETLRRLIAEFVERER